MKHYWVDKETGCTNTTWGNNVMPGTNWVEITKEEKAARDDALLKAWVEANNGVE